MASFKLLKKLGRLFFTVWKKKASHDVLLAFEILPATPAALDSEPEEREPQEPENPEEPEPAAEEPAAEEPIVEEAPRRKLSRKPKFHNSRRDLSAPPVEEAPRRKLSRKAGFYNPRPDLAARLPVSTRPYTPSMASSTNDTSLQVALHPLALLAISDYYTRHNARNLSGMIVGALLGQQNGRQVTIEHAFEVKLQDPDRELVDSEWFLERVQQMKQVYTNPPLELVGWFTLLPADGPQPGHHALATQFIGYNDSALLLGFTPELLHGVRAGGALPLAIYESVYESASEDVAAHGEDAQMKDASAQEQVVLKFRELPYTVETGEAEMIGVSSIAQGATDASVKQNSSSPKTPSKSGVAPGGNGLFDEAGLADFQKDHKGKGKAVEEPSRESVAENEAEDTMTAALQEQQTALTTKIHAIKMLQARIDLFDAYMERLPPGVYFSLVLNPSISEEQRLEPDYQVLRQIQALCTRLNLLNADPESLAQEALAERNDVALIMLLAKMTESTQILRDFGRHSSQVEKEKDRHTGKKVAGGFGNENPHEHGRVYMPNMETRQSARLGGGSGSNFHMLV